MVNRVALLDIRYLRHFSRPKMSLGESVREYVLKIIPPIQKLKDLEIKLNVNL